MSTSSRLLRSRASLLTRAPIYLALTFLSANGWAQSAAARNASRERESSVTVQQIVARQEEHFRKVATAQGTAVWEETSTAPPRREVRYIHFARQGDNSVTLVLPADQAAAYAGTESTLNWSRVIAANLIMGDAVHSVDRPTSGARPVVNIVRFNPAVHENNPLANYHLRNMGDDPLPLRELAAAIPKMKTRPRVLDVIKDGQNLIRIEFQNDAVPGEKLIYEIDPSRAWLTTGVGRVSNGRYLSRTSILVTSMRDGTWIPARKSRTQFDSQGRIVSKDEWHYEHLALNEPLPARALTLMYFRLPPGTQVHGAPADGKPPIAAPRKTPTPAVAPRAARPSPTPSGGMIRLY